MAKSPNSSTPSFLQKLLGGPKAPPPASVNSDSTTGKSVSNRERDKIIERIRSTQPARSRHSSDAYSNYIKPLIHQIADLRLDNKTIEKLAPEVKTAQTIVIPSIISPTDMRDGDITIQSTSTLVSTATNDRISKLLDEHFNTHLKLSRKLPDWLHEVLYGAGSKPLMVLPATEIDTLITDPASMINGSTSYATEGFQTTAELLQKIEYVESTSVFGLADAVQKKTPARVPTAEFSDTLRPAIESLTLKHAVNNELEVGGTAVSYNKGVTFRAESLSCLKAFTTEALESVGIVDNPDVLKVDKAKKAVKANEFKQKMQVRYKTATLITINPETKASVGDPVVYELPPECVIPIFTPGTPTDHIGYFIAIDEHGNPLHIEEQQQNSFVDITDARRTNPASLYKSFGFDSSTKGLTTKHRQEQSTLMMSVYQTIIEAHMTGRLKDNGIDNVYIGTTESIMRCMFSNYLSQRKTKLLFVPKELVTYFCFKHNTDGTGRSKIEDIKFILSLKITLMICRMMAAMNASINRRKITVNLDEKMGDPVSLLRMLEKEAIDKQIVNFTYDPSEVTRTISQKGLTLDVKGIPGAENFSIAQEPYQIQDVKPDESLSEDLSNMLILGLDVPPSALNLLSENEFAKSIATNNLFFSRRIRFYQRHTCDYMAHHIQTYTHMSETVKSKIKDILTTGVAEAKKEGVDDTGTVSAKKLSVDVLLADVIKNITTVLPSPDVAPNKTEFEELDQMISSLSTCLDAIFDDSLGAKDDNPMGLVRGLVKSDIVRQYMKKIGVSKDVDIPAIEAQLLSRIMKHRQTILNISKGIADAQAKTTAAPTDGDTPGDGGASSF